MATRSAKKLAPAHARKAGVAARARTQFAIVAPMAPARFLMMAANCASARQAGGAKSATIRSVLSVLMDQNSAAATVRILAISVVIALAVMHIESFASCFVLMQGRLS